MRKVTRLLDHPAQSLPVGPVGLVCPVVHGLAQPQFSVGVRIMLPQFAVGVQLSQFAVLEAVEVCAEELEVAPHGSQAGEVPPQDLQPHS